MSFSQAWNSFLWYKRMEMKNKNHHSYKDENYKDVWLEEDLKEEINQMTLFDLIDTVLIYEE